jgi:hypothetical protein
MMAINTVCKHFRHYAFVMFLAVCRKLHASAFARAISIKHTKPAGLRFARGTYQSPKRRPDTPMGLLGGKARRVIQYYCKRSLRVFGLAICSVHAYPFRCPYRSVIQSYCYAVQYVQQ